MRIMRKIIRGVSTYGFRVALFGFAFFTALMLTLGSPDPVKTAVNTSGLYDTPLHQLLDFGQLTQEEETPEETQDGPDISLDDPVVQEELAAAFPAEKKQNIMEQMIDGTYVWLNGDAEHPDFTIDVTDEKKVLAQSLADNAFERVNDLEPCTVRQLQSLQGAEFDPFNVPCKPPIDLAAEKQKLIDEYGDSNEFLPDTTLTGEELFEELERHDSINSAENIPFLFGIFKKLPLVLGVLAALTGLGVVLLSDVRRKGVRKLGKLFVETAILLVIVGVGLYFVLDGIGVSIGSQANGGLQAVTGSVVESLRRDILFTGIVITGLYLVAGIVILIITRDTSKLQGNNASSYK